MSGIEAELLAGHSKAGTLERVNDVTSSAAE